MADTRVDRLCRVVEEQQGDIFWLRREAVALREEVAVLRECLIEDGTLVRTSLYARIHWRRFAEVRKTFPFVSDPRFSDLRLDDVFRMDDIALSVCLLGGLRPSRVLSTVSRSLAAAVAVVMPAVQEHRQINIYVCGGRSGKKSLDTVEQYNPKSNSWKVLPRMQQKRNGACAGVVGDYLYVCGGRTSNEPAMSSAERFHPGSGTWEALPEMEYFRWGAMAGCAGGMIHVCGGFGDTGEALSSGERFDPHEHIWEALPDMGERRALAAACVCDGRFYVCGGRDRWERSSTAERFSPRSGVWEVIPPLQEKRSHAVGAAMAGRIYVCGGLDKVGGEMSSVERYNVEASSWEYGLPFSRPRQLVTAVAVADEVYVFGGLCAGEQNLDLVESISRRAAAAGRPLTGGEGPDENGGWKVLAPMAERRSGAAAATSSS